MTRPLPLLIALLLVQCLVTAAVYWRGAGDNAGSRPPNPVNFDPDQIDEIQVSDNQGQEAVLIRSGEQWLLPELESLPADPSALLEALAQLAEGGAGWPVADTVPARQRFQVAAYHYQRRITLIGSGELLGTLYTGTAPGFRRVHLRNDAQREIFSVPLAGYQLPGRPEQWLDRKLLQVRTPVEITADAYHLVRRGERWQAGDGAIPDEREVAALLDSLRHLQILGLADEDSQRDLAQSSPALVLDITSLRGKTRLELFQMEQRYFIYSSEFQLFFELSFRQYDRLLTLDSRLLRGLMAGAG